MATTTKKETPVKKRTRRGWSAPTLYKNLKNYMDQNGLKAEDSISTVLDALRDSIVGEATK